LIVTVDSFAWIEFLAGSEHEARIRDILAESDVLVTPDLVLAEVARRLARDGISQGVVRRKIHEIASLSQVVPIDLEIALGVSEADNELRNRAKTRRQKSPGLSDAVVLSTARHLRAKVLTGDPHFEGFPETLWLGP